MKGRVEILTFVVTNSSFRDFLDANLGQPIAGSMDHMEPSLSSEKVGGAIPLLEAPSDREAVFLKRGILTEDEQVKNVFRLNFVGKVYSISHLAIKVSFGQGDHVRTHRSRQGQCRFHVGGREVAGEIGGVEIWERCPTGERILLLKEKRRKTHFGPTRFSNLTFLTALFLQDVSLKRLTPALYEDAGLWHNT